MFIIGTTYNALKEQKKLENGKLKEILEKRALIKEQALKHKVKSSEKYIFLKFRLGIYSTIHHSSIIKFIIIIIKFHCIGFKLV